MLAILFSAVLLLWSVQSLTRAMFLLDEDEITVQGYYAAILLSYFMMTAGLWVLVQWS